MDKVKLDIVVKPSDGIDSYWVKVGSDSVSLSNGKGSVKLVKGSKHRLIWHMTGEEKAHLKITGKVGSQTVVLVSKTIVTSEGDGAGNKKFET